MAGVNFSRRVLGAVVVVLGVVAWVIDIFLVQTLPYSLYADDALVAMVVLAGAVLVAGGTLAGLWN
ncbi:MAG: SepZ protein [Candidatus Aramenus sp.]|jgi:hypothetical protein|nr:SepZ protein [Candidatus Aramenus sp.]